MGAFGVMSLGPSMIQCDAFQPESGLETHSTADMSPIDLGSLLMNQLDPTCIS